MAGESSWQYEKSTRRFRDKSSGRFLSEANVVKARDAFLLDQQQRYRDTTAKMIAEDASIQAWTREMRQNVKESFSASYMLGKGGRENMTKADWGRVGKLVQAQYGFLDRFAGEIAASRLTAAQATARAALYASSAVQAHAAGQLSAWDVSLPQRPGDGKTACRSNCRCSLSFDETDSEVQVTWNVQSTAEACDDCLRLGDDWNPFTVAKATEQAA